MISRKVALSAAAAVVVAGSSIGIATAASADEATVIRVVDGDTLVVDFEDQETTVRLLNIDTPETKDPNKPVECLGPEASAFLTEALPYGSTVKLEFDVEREDRYGRTLAAVYNDDGLLMNAEIARRGLGVPATFGANIKFRPPVDEAYREAEANEAGLFGAEVGCTVPAMVAALEETAAQAGAEEMGTTAASAAAAAGAVLTLSKTADEGFDAFEAVSKTGASLMWAGLTEAGRTALQTRATEAKDSVHTHHSGLVTLQEERQTTEDQAARKAADAAAAAKRKTEEEETRKAEEAEQAEANRIAEAAAAEAKRLADAVPAPVPVSAPAPAPAPVPAPQPQPQYQPPAQPQPQPQQEYVAPPAQSNPYPGYTDPRCYAPGGKTWRPC